MQNWSCGISTRTGSINYPLTQNPASLDRLQYFHFFKCFVGCTIKSSTFGAPSLLTVFHLLYKTGKWFHHQHPISLVVVIPLSLALTWHEYWLTPSWWCWSWRRLPPSCWKCLSKSWMTGPGYPYCPREISQVSCNNNRLLCSAARLIFLPGDS